MVEQYKYTVYGETTFFDGSGNPISQSAIGNTRLFAATEYDTEIGLYNNQTSNYSPVLGRPLQRDAVANDALLNPYTYANNNGVDVMPMSAPAGMPDGILACQPRNPGAQPPPSPPPPPPPGAVTPPTPPLPSPGAVIPPTQPVVGETPKECPEATEDGVPDDSYIMWILVRAGALDLLPLNSTISVKLDHNGNIIEIEGIPVPPLEEGYLEGFGILDDPIYNAVLAAMGIKTLPGLIRSIPGGIKVFMNWIRSLATKKLRAVIAEIIEESGKRFFKHAPHGSKNFNTQKLANGSTKFSYETPGKVPGSRAIYQKVVDANGKTTSVIKTSYDPKGNVISIKDKLNIK